MPKPGPIHNFDYSEEHTWPGCYFFWPKEPFAGPKPEHHGFGSFDQAFAPPRVSNL